MIAQPLDTKTMLNQLFDELSPKKQLTLLDLARLLKGVEGKSLERQTTSTLPNPLRHSVLRYDDPFDPVVENEWEVLT